MTQVIFPSIIAKNQRELDAELKKLKGAGKTMHLDIVDGKFAPNRSLEFPFKLNQQYKYQAHLMIQKPEVWIKKNLQRIELFIPHFEAIHYHSRYILWMKKMKKKVAFAILPQTNVEHLKEHLPYVDYVLILTVHPGFYGSKYLASELKKIKQIKKINQNVKIIVDGGMNPITIKQAKKAGADLFVSGSYEIESDNPRRSMKELMKALR
ncbi:MAG TPA: hypothetical protein VJI32_00640 [Candidatus Nanoarchaeia archaeon]|nr:hypothetical protein [Candidatus Nanoarchaeia archaeon]